MRRERTDEEEVQVEEKAKLVEQDHGNEGEKLPKVKQNNKKVDRELDS
jgi:hypothetical protein